MRSRKFLKRRTRSRRETCRVRVEELDRKVEFLGRDIGGETGALNRTWLDPVTQLRISSDLGEGV